MGTIALLLALAFGWSQPCYAFSAQHDPFADTYATYLHFGTPTGGVRVWSSQPISATVVYSDTDDTALISLTSALALREQEGAITSRSTTPYSTYLCLPDARPGAVWIPMMQ